MLCPLRWVEKWPSYCLTKCAQTYVAYCMCVCVCVDRFVYFLNAFATSAKVLSNWNTENQSYHHRDCYVMCKFKVHYSSSSIARGMSLSLGMGLGLEMAEMAPSSATTQATIVITICYLDSRLKDTCSQITHRDMCSPLECALPFFHLHSKEGSYPLQVL